MSFILDLQEALDNLNEVLNNYKHLEKTSKISIGTSISSQSKSGYMFTCDIESASIGSLQVEGNSSTIICDKIRSRVRRRIKQLYVTEKSLRKEADEKAAMADVMHDRMLNVKLLAPEPLTELAMCAENQPEEPKSYPLSPYEK